MWWMYIQVPIHAQQSSTQNCGVFIDVMLMAEEAKQSLRDVCFHWQILV